MLCHSFLHVMFCESSFILSAFRQKRQKNEQKRDALHLELCLGELFLVLFSEDNGCNTAALRNCTSSEIG